ncbi:MAG: hypothetical protein KA275_04405 [Chitinophagaceae bacterium]|nr:hypothetical protein [Chitinophagaceae bacterium]
MHCKINSRIFLSEIPSASGIEKINHQFYVIGDDSLHLFILNETDFSIKEKINLVSTIGVFRIPKKEKKDVEAICFAEKEQKILIFGSGSNENRNVLFTIDIKQQHHVENLDISHFYNQLKEKAKLDNADFNIEAAACLGNKLFLFNRGNNVIIRIALPHFFSFIKKETSNLVFETTSIDLGKIQQHQISFSGAATFDGNDNDLFFSATVEATSNWIDDGKVLGSFVGVYNTASQLVDNCPVLENGVQKEIKIESLLVNKKNSETSFEIILVTDADGGESELILADLIIE